MPQRGTKNTKKFPWAFRASLWLMLLAGVACAQVMPGKKAMPNDPNKFAVIINGASGEAAYAKQFEQWTNELSSVLSERFGFDSRQIKVLREKQATAEEVKRTFATLKTQLNT